MTARGKATVSARISARLLRLAAMAAIAGGSLAGTMRPGAANTERIELQIVGGLGGVTQYTKLERPFWEHEIALRSRGRVTASIRPLDAGGIRAKEMLQLLRLGVVPFGTALVSATAGDEPELAAVDLPVLNPDIGTLRRSIAAFRSHLAEILRERYAAELLGVYVYPAQVLFCRGAFTRLGDVAGRKVRTSSVAQSEMMEALGAIPVLLPFAETTAALRDGVADCAVTGTLSGYEIGLPAYATHVQSLAIGWGVSLFAANLSVWKALPADVRNIVRDGVAELERRIWAQAETDTARGLDCNAGKVTCSNASFQPMIVVNASPGASDRRLRLLSDVVLPRWVERCGPDCARAWNTYLAPVHGVRVEEAR